MSDKESSPPEFVLTDEERAGLERVALGEPPHSQRARALLALDGGADLAGAAITADLTPNQVRYWLGRFRPRRLAIFPDEILVVEAVQDVGGGEPPLLAAPEEPPLLTAPEEAPLLSAPEIAGQLPENVSGAVKAGAAVAAVGGAAAIKSKKDKKSKKAKKDKKAKKEKKGKKGKKGKKEKKEKKEKKGKKGKKDKKGKKGKKDKKKK